jgi:5-formyltetrahydrofolate cyclo-ligase
MDDAKTLIRRDMRSQRRRLAPAVVAGAGEAVRRHVLDLEQYRRAEVVLAYVSDENEVPTADLVSLALAAGKRVFLPRMDGERIAFAGYGPEWPLRPGRFGIPEPTGPSLQSRENESIVVLVPLVAWDARGARLGRGRGYYDRALAELGSGASRVGLGYSFQQCTLLPTDPWDVFLDSVVTERGTVRCRGGGNPPVKRREEEQCHGHWMDRAHRRSGGSTRPRL